MSLGDNKQRLKMFNTRNCVARRREENCFLNLELTLRNII